MKPTHAKVHKSAKHLSPNVQSLFKKSSLVFLVQGNIDGKGIEGRKSHQKTAGSLRSKKSGRFLYVNYPPPTLRLE
ncbi:hypothetical protein ABEV12_05615, partial [Geobacillus stearothermophilus]|uniref:hypothetical protein n=1 Tax=Geobacillus stearothermophilus TaxID=1422 RepID=UPI003D262F25